jgi:adenylate cyclase
MYARGWDTPIIGPEIAVILATFGAYVGRFFTEGQHRRLLEQTFSNFVSADVLASVVDAGEVPLTGARQEVTVLFSDIRNFTTYSEDRDPHQVVDELNEYFGEMAESVIKHGGMVNKYIGDGIMALFGAPVPHPDHARRAVLCARDMLVRLEHLNHRRVAKGLEEWRIGIGIHTGPAVVGNVGAKDTKMEYTANGDTVNVASRIEGLNKKFGTQVLLSYQTRERMGVDVPTVFKGYQELKGRKEETAVYTVN